MYGDIEILIKSFPNISLLIIAIGLFSVKLVPLILLPHTVYSKLVIKFELDLLFFVV